MPIDQRLHEHQKPSWFFPCSRWYYSYKYNIRYRFYRFTSSSITKPSDFTSLVWCWETRKWNEKNQQKNQQSKQHRITAVILGITFYLKTNFHIDFSIAAPTLNWPNIVGAATLSILITKRYLSRFMLYSYIYIIIQFKFHYLFLIKSHLQSYPCPNNINSFWNIGFLLGISIVLQLIMDVFVDKRSG